MAIEQLIQQQAASIPELRHRLHQVPELAYEEFKTAAIIRDELDRIGLKYVAGVEGAPTATIAWLGDTSKPCVALRADIDALPIVERTDLPYSSTHPGRMHACGHDGHTSILLGTAAVLNGIASQLPVCVKLIWQPAEEGGGGADQLCKAGVLDGRVGPKVDAIFGLHGWPGLPVGTVSTRPGELLAGTDTFSVTFLGKGCHGGAPHLGHDPIIAACDAVVNLQQSVTRDLDPSEPAVVSVGTFHAGTAPNVIPDRARIEGTVRTLSPVTRKLIEQSLRRRCQGIAAACGCEAEFDWENGAPPTINDPDMARYVGEIARTKLGPNHFIPAGRPSMIAEDFAFYLEKVPGCFFVVGVCPEGRQEYPSLHSDRFDFTDSGLGIGIRMFVELVRNFSTT